MAEQVNGPLGVEEVALEDALGPLVRVTVGSWTLGLGRKAQERHIKHVTKCYKLFLFHKNKESSDS